MALVNMTEVIVRKRLSDMLENMDCCKCEQCYLDMLALALNQLPAVYVNSHQGELISRVNSGTIQKTIDMDVAVIKAINIVSASPHRSAPAAQPVQEKPENAPEQ